MTQEKKRHSKKTTVAGIQKTAQTTIDINGLRESEAKFRGFIENLSVMFYAAEPHPPYAPIYISPAFEQFGYPLEEWRESFDLWMRVLHPEDCHWVLEKTEAAMRTGEETDYEYRIIAKNGDVHWLRDRGSFVRDEQGNIVCWQGIILDVTNRKVGEQKLLHSEKLYRTLAHSIPQTAVVLFDADFRYTLADGLLLEKHGFSREMFEGKTLWEVFPPEISEEWSDYYRRALGGEIVSLEQESEEGCFQIYVVPVKNEKGEIFAGMVMWQDITTKKRIENDLRESEKRYRDLTEKSLGLICSHDLDGTLLFINAAAAKNLGYTPEEMIGNPLQSFIPPGDIPFFQTYLERIEAEGEFFNSFRVLTKEGETRILKFSNTLYKENGKPAFVLGNAQDITELKRTERELQALFEAMNDVIIVLDKNGRYLKIAPTNPSLLYRPPEELMGKTLTETFPAEQAETFLKVVRAALETKQTQKLEYILSINGQEMWFVATVSPMTADSVILIARDITESKQAEEKLQASSNLLNGLIEGTPDAVFVKDLDGRYLMINAAGARFFGKTAADFIGHTDAEIYPAKMAKRFTEADRQVMESGETQTFEGIATAADGSVHTYLVTKAAYRNQQGDIVGLIGISHDITERKKAEEALKESEERYRNLFEKAYDLIYIHDLKGNFISVNQAAERVFGYSREEALKMNIGQVAAPEHLELARQMLREKIGGVNQTAYEIDCITSDGRRITLEVNSSVIYKDGEAVAIQGIARDITGRKQTEAALKEREQQYRELFENANDLIYTHDLAGNFTSLNRAGEIITGFSREEALKRNIKEIVAPDYLEKARGMIMRKVAGEPPTTYELVIIAKEGHRVSLELSTRLIIQNGKPVGVQGIGRDITERKLTEEALKESERRYRSLGEGIMHQVWTAQPNGKLDYVNGRTLEYFGRTSQQILGEGWQSVVHPEDLPECVKRWTYSLETGKDYEVEFRLRRHDGEYRWHKARATAGLDADGRIVNWFGTNTDINDKKIAEAKLNHNALHDSLTNLPNRVKFMNHLERAVSRSERNSAFRFAVLFLTSTVSK